MDDAGNWKANTLLLGAVIGALTGVGTAYLLKRVGELGDGGS